MLLVRSLRRMGSGRRRTASPSGMFASIHAASFDWVFEYFSTATSSRRFASSREGALKMARMSAAAWALRSCLVMWAWALRWMWHCLRRLVGVSSLLHFGVALLTEQIIPVFVLGFVQVVMLTDGDMFMTEAAMLMIPSFCLSFKLPVS